MSVTCCLGSACDDSGCLQLTEREARVCEVVCGSTEPIAFSSLRNNLGYHQEVVSRILKRLINYGAIEKVRGKYRQVSQ